MVENDINLNADYLARMGHKWFKPENETSYGRDQEILANVAKIPFQLEPLGDISYLAYSHTSWSPERSAMLEECAYTSGVANLCAEVLAARNDDQAKIMLRDYAIRLRLHYIAYLSAHARCISSAVTGPAKFPVARAEAANRTAHKRHDELTEYIEKASERLKRNLGLIQSSSMVISSDDPDAIIKLNEKLANYQKYHDRAIAGNKVMRSSLTMQEKQAKLLEIGFTEKELERCIVAFSGKFENIYFNTTNTLAEIHRIESRIKEIETKRSQQSGEIAFTGGTLVDNVEENRVQLVFDSKPEKDVIEQLKSHGFRWSPRNSAWQRQRTSSALRAAKEIAGIPASAVPQSPETQPETSAPAAPPAAAASMPPVEKSKAEKAADFVKSHVVFGMVPPHPGKTVADQTPENESVPEVVPIAKPEESAPETPPTTAPEEEKKNPAKAAMDQIDSKIAELEKNIESPETEKTIKDWLRYQSQFHSYSMQNTFFLYAQALSRNTELHDVASFTTWSGMKGANGEKVCIRKGEKAYKVICPCGGRKLYEKDDSGAPKLDDNGEKIPLLDPDGNPIEYIKYKVGYVFDRTQTNAVEIGAVKELDCNCKTEVNAGIVQDFAERITKGYGIPVSFRSEPLMSYGGWYNPQSHEIVINTHTSKTNGEQLAVLCHELGHALMHGRDSAKYTKELKEGQAEAFAYALGTQFGLEMKSELYIKNWISEKVPLKDVLKDISGNVRTAYEKLQLQELVIRARMERDPLAENVVPAIDPKAIYVEVFNAVSLHMTSKNKDLKKTLEYIDKADEKTLAGLYSIVQDSRRDNIPGWQTAALIDREVQHQIKQQKNKSVEQKNDAQLSLF